MSYPAMNRRLLAIALVLAMPASASAVVNVQVAAAASLTGALNEAITLYEAQHEVAITPIYASSSTLARQIASGSPAALFLSANIEWMDWLEAQGIKVMQRSDLLHNRLALVSASPDLPQQFTPGGGTNIATLLGHRDRLSVGDPDHVPAGIYTQQALEALGEWSELLPRLARSNDVRAALTLVERQETPIGVVYQTDALASERIRVLGLFPADSHAPIIYPIALIDAEQNDAEQNDAAAALREWLESEEALRIFAKHGFDTGIDTP